LSTNKGGLNEFLVPDSCRATGRNCSSISTDVTDEAIEND